jgi:adenylate kinase family enzyme
MESISVALFGIAGSGKGTQADLLEKYLKKDGAAVVRPEMGVLLRTFMQTGTSLAQKTNEIVTAGELVPSFIPIHLLTGMLNDTFDGTQHVILDGTCRRPDQSRAANDMMRLWGRTNLHIVELTLTPESAKKRLALRGRSDDADDDVIAARFAWYKEQVVPSIDELKSLGWAYHEIDGEPEIEVIHKNILSTLSLA